MEKNLHNLKDTRLEFLGRWTRKLPIFAFVCFIGITLFIQTLFVIRGVGHRIIYSDGAGYYAWARSIVYDHDLDFKNDFEILYPPDEPPLQPEKTKANKHMNKYPPAMGVLELPAILAGHVAAIMTDCKTDGRSLPYQFSAALYLTLLNSLGLFFLYKLLMQEGFTPIWALAFTGTLLCCSNLIHYIIKEPSLVHGAGFCGICISLWWFSKPDREFDFMQAMLIGAVMGLFLSLRYTNIALLPVFGVIFLSHPKKSLSAALGLTTGGFIIMS
ncbi:MAG: hypothetical protein JNJ69_02420, partial [Leptospiraceae bacterium]|nr:hypothetical protein [Leptospiraceae bacterium]